MLTEIEVHSRAPVITTATVTSSNLQNIVSHIMAEQALLMMTFSTPIVLSEFYSFLMFIKFAQFILLLFFSTLLFFFFFYVFVASVTKFWFTKVFLHFFEVIEVYPVKCLPAVYNYHCCKLRLEGLLYPHEQYSHRKTKHQSQCSVTTSTL